jgi:hypothetical protein
MVVCEICGEEFETSQGLAGHKQFKHGAKGTEQVDKSESRAITRLSHWTALSRICGCPRCRRRTMASITSMSLVSMTG